MPFGIQPIHIIVVAIVALLIFGPTRLPEIGRGLGKALNEFRKGTKEMTEGFREEISQRDTTQMPVQQMPVQPPIQNISSTSSATPMEGNNFCVHCGAPNPSGARFCNKCGSQMPSTPVS